MSTEILMPALSPTMEEGKLAKWLVKEGDTVKSGTILAEIETDKATMEFEAVDEGKIGKILVPEGSEGVKVNAPIAVLLDDGEKIARRLRPESITHKAHPSSPDVQAVMPREAYGDTRRCSRRPCLPRHPPWPLCRSKTCLRIGRCRPERDNDSHTPCSNPQYRLPPGLLDHGLSQEASSDRYMCA